MNDSNHDKKKNKNQSPSQATLPTEAPPAASPASPAPVITDAALPPPAPVAEKKAYTKADVRGLLEAAYAADDAILTANAAILTATAQRNEALMAVEAVMGSLGPFNFKGKAISITKRNRKGHAKDPSLTPIYRFEGKEELTPIEI